MIKGGNKVKQVQNELPKTKLQWIWENMEGSSGLSIVGIFRTLLYNVLQLTVPYFSGKIVDLFLSGSQARENMQNKSGIRKQRC